MKYLMSGIVSIVGFVTWAFAEEVVVYVALDEIYARPVLEAYGESSGVAVRAVYDTEASKTTGLVNRLIAEQRRPRADVFWNNEVAQTLVLKEKGVLAPYVPEAATDLPERFRGPEGYWTGLAARARVIIYNTETVAEPPVSVKELLDPKWKGKAAIANPLFGTTATHAAALFALWGAEEAQAFFAGLNANEVAVLPGNAQVRDAVAQGKYAWGLTDTDDANGGVEDGYPVQWHFPDQEHGGLGTLLIPNALALINDSPNPDGGKALIKYLLTAAVEERLAASRSIQIPLNADATKPEKVPTLSDIHTMAVGFEDVARAMPESAAYLRETFLR